MSWPTWSQVTFSSARVPQDGQNATDINDVLCPLRHRLHQSLIEKCGDGGPLLAESSAHHVPGLDHHRSMPKSAHKLSPRVFYGI